jgi:hypothetical protein
MWDKWVGCHFDKSQTEKRLGVIKIQLASQNSGCGIWASRRVH